VKVSLGEPRPYLPNTRPFLEPLEEAAWLLGEATIMINEAVRTVGTVTRLGAQSASGVWKHELPRSMTYDWVLEITWSNGKKTGRSGSYTLDFAS